MRSNKKNLKNLQFIQIKHVDVDIYKKPNYIEH